MAGDSAQIRHKPKPRPKRKLSTIAQRELRRRTTAVLRDSLVALDIGDDDLIINSWLNEPTFIFLDKPNLPGAEAICRQLEKFALNVGRIDDPNQKHIGTGILISDDLVLTARHVMVPIKSAVGKIKLKAQASFDLAPGPSATSPRRHKIVELVWSRGGDEKIDFADDELALVRIEPKANASTVDVDWSYSPGDSSPAVALIGFPADELAANAGNIDAAGAGEDVERVFGPAHDPRYARKRIGIGNWMRKHAGSSLYFDHTAPSLPACSGGAVIDLSSMRVVGVHCGGAHLVGNFGQSLQETVTKAAGAGLFVHTLKKYGLIF